MNRRLFPRHAAAVCAIALLALVSAAVTATGSVHKIILLEHFGDCC
jgi:hypothetical protein